MECQVPLFQNLPVGLFDARNFTLHQLPEVGDFLGNLPGDRVWSLGAILWHDGSEFNAEDGFILLDALRAVDQKEDAPASFAPNHECANGVFEFFRVAVKFHDRLVDQINQVGSREFGHVGSKA